MKKLVLALLVIVALVLGLFAFSVFGEEVASETVAFVPYTAEDGTGTRQYCICGNKYVADANGTIAYVNGEGGCKNEKDADGNVIQGCDGTLHSFLPWEKTTTLPAGSDETEAVYMYYYLTGMVTLSGQQNIQTHNNVTLDLNGQTVKNTTGKRIYVTMDPNTSLNLLDSSPVQTGLIVGSGTNTDHSFGLWARYGTINFFSGTVDMTDLSISKYGCGVSVNSTATFNMFDGVIKGGETGTYGAAVSVNPGGTFNLYDGTIHGGKATTQGGAVYVNTGTTGVGAFNMYGGTVYGGEATTGAAVYVKASGTTTDGTAYDAAIANFYGGTVYNGTASGNGNGIYGAGVVTVGGDVVIEQLYVGGGKIFTIDGLAGSVGLAATNKGSTLATAASAEEAACFHSVQSGYTVKVGRAYQILLDDHAEHCVCGDNYADHTCTNENWTPWGLTSAEKKAIPTTAGNYYLVSNLTLSGAKTVPVDTEVKLCLNGYSISSNNRLNNKGTLHITDCSAEWGTISSTYTGRFGGLLYLYENSVTHLYAGTWDGSNTGMAQGGVANVGNSDAATLNIYNGEFIGGTLTMANVGTSTTPTHTRGGVFSIIAGSTVNMYGGSITGGSNATYGGAVHVHNNSHFNMYGGSIVGGAANADDTAKGDQTSIGGGSIYVNGAGTLTIDGGSVTGGSTTGNGSGIYVYKNDQLTVKGESVIDKLYLADGITFATDGLTGSVGIEAAPADQVLTTVQTKEEAACFTSLVEGLKVKTVATEDGYNVILNSRDDYCVCGGHAVGMQEHTCENISWTPWGATDAEKASLPNLEGNYYLVDDITISETQTLTKGHKINIDLDGNNIFGDSARIFAIRGEVSITDSSAQADWGTISSTNDSKATGGIFYMYNDAALTIYAGNWDASQVQIAQGGIGVVGSSEPAYLNIYGGNFTAATLVAKTDGSTDTRGGAFYVIAGSTLNLYGGTVTGGRSLKNGGTLNANGDATGTEALNAASDLLGGSIFFYKTGTYTIGGTAVVGMDDQGNVSGGAAYYGGNIFLYAGELNITGGTITGGSAANSGGNIGTNKSDDVILNISSGTISGGTSDAAGGNISLRPGSVCNITGGTITGGTAANHGGNIVVFGELNISGGIITGGTVSATGGSNGGGNISVWANGATFNMTGGTVSNGASTNEAGTANGANILVYANSTNTSTASITGGTVEGLGEGNNADASINVTGNSTNLVTLTLGGTAVLNDGVKLSGNSNVTMYGDPTIELLRIVNSNAALTVDVSGLNCTTPIPVKVSKTPAKFAVSTVDVSSSFTSADPIKEVVYDAEGQEVIMNWLQQDHVYVSVEGDDGNLGTEDAPVKTMARAMNTVKNGGTIHLVGTVELTVWEAHEKSFTITGDELVMPETRVYLNDHVTFDDLTLTMPMCTTSTSGNYGSYFFYCDGFTTVIQEGVTIRYLFDGQYLTDPYHTVNQTLDDGTTKELNATSYLYGGCNSSFGTVSGTDLTVMSGVWGNIFGGNDAVDLTGDIHLTVGGKVNEGVDYVSHTHSGWHLILGGSRVANIDGTIYMDVIGGNNHTSTHGGSQGNSTTTYSIGAIELHASGGNGMAIYGGGRGGELNIGTINFYYEGATFEQVFGGSLSQCVTGDVNLTVTGGSITRRLYGGCYTNREESPLGSWDPINYVTGNVNLIIGSGADISCNLMKPDGSELYNDRGIYGHSRQPDASASDAENARIIFLDYAAYTKHKGNLKAQDTVMQVLMSGVTAADYICYLGWSANDETDVITSGATEVEDNAGNALDLPAQTATLKIEDGQFGYQDTAVTPAYVEYSDNWDLGELTLTYANNNAVGTATATASINGYSVSKDFEIRECKYLAIVNGQTSKYLKLQDAVDNAAGGYVKLLAGCSDAITVNTDLYLDLNGFDLTGTVTVAEGATLYGMDSTTDGYDCSDGYGKITDLVGTYAAHHKTDVTGRILRYLAVNEDGTVSFHRIYLGITKVYLKPGTVGFGYKAVFGGDEKVQALLGESEAFGYGLWVEGSENKVTRYKGAPDFKTGQLLTLGLNNIDVENYSATQICAEVYLKLEDGTVITSAAYSYSLQDMVKALDSSMASDDSSYSESQIAAVKKLYQTYATVMEGWNLNYINKE